MQNYQDLIDAGIIDNEGYLLRPLDLREITNGAESGVWKEWTVKRVGWSDRKSDVYCAVNNWERYGKLYEFLEDDKLHGIRIVAFCASFNLYAWTVIGDQEISDCESEGAADDEIESLKDKKETGDRYEIIIDEGRGETRFIEIFHPWDWA